jgi:hypothetical protein
MTPFEGRIPHAHGYPENTDELLDGAIFLDPLGIAKMSFAAFKEQIRRAHHCFKHYFSFLDTKVFPLSWRAFKMSSMSTRRHLFPGGIAVQSS